MKVTIGKDTYLVHWKTISFSPESGRNTGLELKATDCIIDKLVGGEREEVARGHSSQNSCDTPNSVTGRRISFIKAISGLSRDIRHGLGMEYNRTCRVTDRTLAMKNRLLKKRISVLSARIEELERSQNKVMS